MKFTADERKKKEISYALRAFSTASTGRLSGRYRRSAEADG